MGYSLFSVILVKIMHVNGEMTNKVMYLKGSANLTYNTWKIRKVCNNLHCMAKMVEAECPCLEWRQSSKALMISPHFLLINSGRRWCLGTQIFRNSPFANEVSGGCFFLTSLGRLRIFLLTPPPSLNHSYSTGVLVVRTGSPPIHVRTGLINSYCGDCLEWIVNIQFV